MPKNYNITARVRREGALGVFGTHRTSMTARDDCVDLRAKAIEALRDDGFETIHIISVQEQKNG
jgi:hypothetical protein